MTWKGSERRVSRYISYIFRYNIPIHRRVDIFHDIGRYPRYFISPLILLPQSSSSLYYDEDENIYDCWSNFMDNLSRRDDDYDDDRIIRIEISWELNGRILFLLNYLLFFSNGIFFGSWKINNNNRSIIY